MRRTSALVSSVATVAMLSAVLAGCAASPDDVSACTPLLAPGDVSELVSATGAVGSKPTVDVPAPLVVKDSQRSVLVEGSGLVAQKGMTVDFDATVLDGESGSVLLSTKFDPADPVRFRAGLKTSSTQEDVPALAASLTCAQAGERLAVTTSSAESGLDLQSVGITDADHAIVFVVDVRAVYLGKADGINQIPGDGLPVVVTAPDGTVGITIPSGIDVPSSDRIATIKLGSGPKLAADDDAVLQLAVWTWPTDGSDATSKSSTWKTGSTPQTVTLVTDGEKALPAPLIDALVGATVGSQILVVVAPSGDVTDATIYVIDVLGVREPADSTK